MCLFAFPNVVDFLFFSSFIYFFLYFSLSTWILYYCLAACLTYLPGTSFPSHFLLAYSYPFIPLPPFLFHWFSYFLLFSCLSRCWFPVHPDLRCWFQPVGFAWAMTHFLDHGTGLGGYFKPCSGQPEVKNCMPSPWVGKREKVLKGIITSLVLV